jgi:hypothetical protein
MSVKPERPYGLAGNHPLLATLLLAVHNKRAIPSHRLPDGFAATSSRLSSDAPSLVADALSPRSKTTSWSWRASIPSNCPVLQSHRRRCCSSLGRGSKCERASRQVHIEDRIRVSISFDAQGLARHHLGSDRSLRIARYRVLETQVSWYLGGVIFASSAGSPKAGSHAAYLLHDKGFAWLGELNRCRQSSTARRHGVSSLVAPRVAVLHFLQQIGHGFDRGAVRREPAGLARAGLRRPEMVSNRKGSISMRSGPGMPGEGSRRRHRERAQR